MRLGAGPTVDQERVIQDVGRTVSKKIERITMEGRSMRRYRIVVVVEGGK